MQYVNENTCKAKKQNIQTQDVKEYQRIQRKVHQNETHEADSGLSAKNNQSDFTIPGPPCIAKNLLRNHTSLSPLESHFSKSQEHRRPHDVQDKAASRNHQEATSKSNI